MRLTDPDWPSSVLRRYEPMLALKPESFIRPWFAGISRRPFTGLFRLSPLAMPFVSGVAFHSGVNAQAPEMGPNLGRERGGPSGYGQGGVVSAKTMSPRWEASHSQSPALDLHHDLPGRAFAARLMSGKQELGKSGGPSLSTRILRQRIHEQSVQGIRQVEEKAGDSGLHRTGMKREAGVPGAGTSGQGAEPRAASMQGEKVPASRGVSSSASQDRALQGAVTRDGQEPYYSAGGTQGGSPGRTDAVSTHSPRGEGGSLRFPLLDHIYSRTKIAGKSRGYLAWPKRSGEIGEIMMTPSQESGGLTFGGKGSLLPTRKKRGAGVTVMGQSVLQGKRTPDAGPGAPSAISAPRPADSHKVLVQERAPSSVQEVGGARKTPKDAGAEYHEASNSDVSASSSRDGTLPRFPLLDLVQARVRTGGLQQPWQQDGVISNDSRMHGYVHPGPFTSTSVFTEKAKGGVPYRISRAEESQGNFTTGSIRFAPGSGEHKGSLVQATPPSPGGEPGAIQRLEMPLSGSHQVQRLSPASHRGASSLPLVQLQGEGAAGSTTLQGEAGSWPGSTEEGSFSGVPGVQGGPGETAAADGGLSSGPGGRGSLQGIDMESLADEVYAIIERRLIIERESMGL